jgi:hypothetical protein
MRAIVASDETKAQIIDVARSLYPEEACGLITVKGDKLSMRPCQNTHGDKKHMGCCCAWLSSISTPVALTTQNLKQRPFTGSRNDWRTVNAIKKPLPNLLDKDDPGS